VNDSAKTKQQLIKELIELRRRVASLEDAQQPQPDNSRRREAPASLDVAGDAQADDALWQSEERYRALTESTSDMIYILDGSGRVLYVNRSAARFLGCDAQSAVGKFQDAIFPPQRAAQHKGTIARVFSGGESFEKDETYRVGPDEVWLNTRIMPLHNPRGEITAVMGVSRNVTARKRTEAALAQVRDELEKRVELRTAELVKAEREWERTFDSVPDLIAVLDRSSRIVRVNRAMAERLSLTPEQCVGARCCEAVHGLREPPTACPNALTLVDGKGHSVEMYEVRLGGDFLVTTTPIFDEHDQLIGSVHVARDVSEQKRAREALQASEEKYRGLLDICPDAIVVADLTGRAIFTSRQTWRLLDVPESQDLTGQSVLDYVIEPDRPRLAARIASLLQVGKQEHTEYSVLRPSGARVPVELSSAVIRNGAGQPVAQMAIIRDISERKQAEETLRQSEEKYRGLVEIFPDTVVVTDLDAKAIFISPQVSTLLGLPEGVNLVGRNVLDFVVEADRQRLTENIDDLIRVGTQKHMEYTALSPGGSTVPIELSSAVIRDARGHPTGLMAVIRDISERRRAEEALKKEHRTLQHLLQSSDHERQLIAYEIHDGPTQQLAAAIMQLESYACLRHSDPEVAQKAFDAALAMLRQAHFEARRLISGVRPPILDESGIVAAITHLVNEHRLQNGPTIELRTEVSFERLVPTIENAVYRVVQEGLANACKHSNSSTVRVELLERGDVLQIKVKDWGVGFNVNDVSDDRFGLTGIRERARLLGGKATLESKPGQGTCLTVDFPLVLLDETG
jgi:PAS domain S-box-containing protein